MYPEDKRAKTGRGKRRISKNPVIFKGGQKTKWTMASVVITALARKEGKRVQRRLRR